MDTLKRRVTNKACGGTEQPSICPTDVRKPGENPQSSSPTPRETAIGNETAGAAPLDLLTTATTDGNGIQTVNRALPTGTLSYPGLTLRTSSPLQYYGSPEISNGQIVGEDHHNDGTMHSVDSHAHHLQEQGTPAYNGGKESHRSKAHPSKKREGPDSPGQALTDDNRSKVQPKSHRTVSNQIRNMLCSSWINVLLIMSPVGVVVHFAKVDHVAVFVLNFVAIIPLARTLSYATEETALRTGEVVGGLLNATFGNAVELIVSIIALVKNQTLIVQTSLVGSMLSNLLLVMGMCFFFGGINRLEQNFNVTVAQTSASLLFLAVSGLIIPTAFDEFARTGENRVPADLSKPKDHVATLSRATAILLLIVYACYLFFQLKSHSRIFSKTGEMTAKRDIKGKLRSHLPERFRKPSLEAQTTIEEADDRSENPQLHIFVAIGTLVVSTVLVALNAEFLVDSINSITCDGRISKNFVGLILLPIIGNAAEHTTAVTVAMKDKMDLAIAVAVGSSMQIALLILPFTVVLGWILGRGDMTLFFDGFQIAILFVTVLLVNYLIQDGKSHWLEGVLLMTLYIIIAVAAWYYPTSLALSDCPT